MSPKSEKVLTAKIAQKAVARGDCDLNEYTTIEDAAAEVLAKYEGYLQLNGIRELKANPARLLACHNGGLSLNGILSLSEEVTELLSNLQGRGRLSLDGLSELTKISAYHLALVLTESPAHPPSWLDLNGLADIPAEVLETLAKGKGMLGLSSFKNITMESANILSKHQGGLHLGNLESLRPEIASVLARIPAISLSIKNLSDELLTIFDEEGVWIHDLLEIKKVARAVYSDDREFIVSLSFEYCEVKYSGFRIMKKGEIRCLVAALNTDAKIGTPNMPGEWYEEFDISLLKDCFEIYSALPSSIRAMREVFPDDVGETSLFDSVLEHAPASDD